MPKLNEELLAELSAKAANSFCWSPRVLLPKEEPKQAKPEKDSRTLSKDALDWLYDLSQHPFRQTTVRDRLLNFSGYRAKNVRDEIEKLGYVRRHVIPTGKRGGQWILEEITDAGYEYLAQLQVSARKPRGKGGYVHKFWQHKVAEWLSGKHEGADVTVEDAGSQKLVDVSFRVASQPDGAVKAVAFEILVNGEDKELVNVAKDLAAGFDEVVLCVDRWELVERLKGKILKELGEYVLQKTRFELLTRFLE